MLFPRGLVVSGSGEISCESVTVPIVPDRSTERFPTELHLTQPGRAGWLLVTCVM